MKVAFVHIPKTGGASVYRWWYQNLKDSQYQLIRNDHLFLNSIQENYDTSFTITRNTWDRLISLYVFQKVKCEQRIPKNYKVEHYTKMLDVWHKGIEYYIDYSLDKGYNGTTSQLEYIKGVENIFSNETLSDDFKKIKKWFQCDIPLKRNVHIGKYNKKDYLTPKFIDFVYKRFEKEIEYFSYCPTL